LFAAHADTVAGWASRLCGPAIDVEDVVQEVFIVVHRKLARFRGESNVTTWLYGITANVVREHRRKARRRRWFGGRDEEVEDVPAVPTPLEEIERQRNERAVYRVLDAMREHHRDVLILSEVEGLSGEEIAEITATKIGTVWVRLHRARAEFAELARRLVPDQVDAAEDARRQQALRDLHAGVR
jgi:RNA polymerase sigma-70 factor (ECF subfamily)